MGNYWSNVNNGQPNKTSDFQYVLAPKADETQGATAANQQKNEPVVKAQQKENGDTFKTTGDKKPNVDAQSQAAENNKKDVDEKSNNKYAADVAAKLYQDPNKNKDAIAQLTQMTAAANRSDYKEAAAKYEMLQRSGALNEIGDPPYLDQIKSELAKKNEQKDDVERARNSVNSNDGVDKMIEYYKAHDTKEKLHEAYDDKLKALGGSELHGARKMARANKKNLKSLEKQQALENEGVVVGDKKAYKKARKEAGNKDSVSYMSEGGMNVAQRINDALLEQGKPTILKEDGTIDVDAAQEYARQRVSTAGDRADKNEIAELAKEFGVSKKDVKAFFKGINVDYQKNYTIPGIAAGVVAGTATLLNPLAGATVGAVAGATNVYTDVTTTNTIEKSSILNGDQVEESIKNKSETTTNVRKEEVPGSSGHRRLGFGDFLGAAATGVAVEELVRKVVNHDSQILKKNKTIENVLSDKPEKVVRKKSNQDKVRLIQGYDLSAKGYDAETAKQIKLALLSDAMGKGGKLNSRELNGVLAQLEAVPEKPKAQTPPPEEQTPPPEEQTPPPFDPSKYGTNYKLGNGFWNDKLQNADGSFGGYVKNPDGSLVQEISGEKANEIGAFGRDNRLDERHKKDSYQVKVPEIGVEHDNWANENKRGKALWGYLHGLLYGNTVANIDESAMRDNALQALANPQSVVVTDPTYGNVWTLTRRDDGNYELTDLKDKDGASLKINKKHVYSLNSLQKKDKDTSNNVAAGFEYQFTNISGSDNGDGRSASDKLTAQIQDDYKKNHQVKKGKRR